MRDRLKRFLQTSTSKNIIINTLGNYLNVAFIALFALILFRSLDPQEYGPLSVLLGVAYVLTNILEFGTTATIYSTVPVLHQENEQKLYTFIKSTFFYQSFFSVIVIGTLILIFPWLDRIFFKTGAPVWILTLTALSVFMYIWQNFLTNILFAAKRFFRANLYLNIANFIKALTLLAFAFSGSMSVSAVIVIYGFIGPGVYFLLVLYKNYERLPHVQAAAIRREEFKFRYTMTYFVASQFYNVGLRMDLFLLSFYGLGAQVGYYASAQKIVLSIVSTIVSVSQVLSPQFAMIKNKVDAAKILKKGFAYMLLPSMLFVLLYFTPQALFEIILTDKYIPAIAVTKVLAFPFILYTVGTIPMLFLLYTVKKPVYILWSNILFFIIVTGGSYILIPEKGMFGPPVALFIALAVAIGIQSMAVIREFK